MSLAFDASMKKRRKYHSSDTWSSSSFLTHSQDDSRDFSVEELLSSVSSFSSFLPVLESWSPLGSIPSKMTEKNDDMLCVSRQSHFKGIDIEMKDKRKRLQVSDEEKRKESLMCHSFLFFWGMLSWNHCWLFWFPSSTTIFIVFSLKGLTSLRSRLSSFSSTCKEMGSERSWLSLNHFTRIPSLDFLFSFKTLFLWCSPWLGNSLRDCVSFDPSNFWWGYTVTHSSSFDSLVNHTLLLSSILRKKKMVITMVKFFLLWQGWLEMMMKLKCMTHTRFENNDEEREEGWRERLNFNASCMKWHPLLSSSFL